MPVSNLQQQLEEDSGIKLRLKINDNRSTMLSVRWEPDYTKVSIHRIFLKAPPNVMQALACYLKREDKIIAPTVKAFIEDNLKDLDYSHLLDKQKLFSRGNVYNLKQIFNSINNEYFNGKLKLLITWFGKSEQTNRSRVTFGLYYDPLKLIKINRLLDSPAFPDYLIAYVIYHEMLHHVCPAYVDAKGLNHVHSKEFKERESKFKYYDLALTWIKDHEAEFFAQAN